MEEMRLLCVLMKNCHIYNVENDNIFIQDKNCYIVTKYGSMTRPFICYDRKVGGKTIDSEMVIGGYNELLRFLDTKSNSKIYFRGFNIATICKILRIVMENRDNKIEQKKAISNSDELSQECRLVANYIIEEVNKYNKDKLYGEQFFIFVMTLQKLLYYCDIEHMKEHNGTPLFSDQFYAWPNGPTIPGLYNKYTQCKYGKIYPVYDGITMTITDEMKSIADKILEEYKNFSSVDIEEECKVNDGPWAQVFDANGKKYTQVISKEEMYNYYSKGIIYNIKKRLKRK